MLAYLIHVSDCTIFLNFRYNTPEQLQQFNYGKRGILDIDHKRLFTFGSLRQALRNSGYEIIEERGIPAPYPLAIGDNILSRFLLLVNHILMFFSKGMFAYQIAIVAQPLPTLEHLLDDAYKASEELLTTYGETSIKH
ncbi:MAG: hypothetical protein Q9P01_11845 [Anaerolineae bacterium]|nr:hypothetical protein [Anaerolineae bacterium]